MPNPNTLSYGPDHPKHPRYQASLNLSLELDSLNSSFQSTRSSKSQNILTSEHFIESQPRDTPFTRCPFDPSHQMPPNRLLTHINRCKSPSKKYFEMCPYNPEHWFIHQEMQIHLGVCEDRLEYMFGKETEKVKGVIKNRNPIIRQKKAKKEQKQSEEYSLKGSSANSYKSQYQLDKQAYENYLIEDF